MIFIDEMKNLKLYRKPVWLPTLDSDKKKKSVVYLLTPNYQSSKNLMLNPLLINKKRFESYYMERDLTYFINSKVMSKVDDLSETYIRDFTSYDCYQSLIEMTAAERNSLPDKAFGLPKQRKYPLDTHEHLLSAIKFFNYVSKKDEKELAKNINKAIDYFCDSGELPNVSKKNRFYKYYTKAHHEAVDLTNLTTAFSYYHAEITRKGFNPKSCSGNWDEELYYKTLELAVMNPFGGDPYPDYCCHVYTMGDDYAAIYLGIVHVFTTSNGTKDWEWDEQEPIDPKMVAHIRDEVQRPKYVSEAAVADKGVTNVDITDIYGKYGSDGLWNSYVKVRQYPGMPLRGKSELLIIKGNKIFVAPSDDGGVRFPGGTWDEGEDHLLAAKRETKEEAHIIAKDIRPCGYYVNIYDKQKGWMTEKLPKEDWWYGEYVELYIGYYDKKYNGRVEEVDQDHNMTKYGKFVPITSVYNKLNPIQKAAVNDILDLSLSESEVPDKCMSSDDELAYVADTIRSMISPTAEFFTPTKNILNTDGIIIGCCDRNASIELVSLLNFKMYNSIFNQYVCDSIDGDEGYDLIRIKKGSSEELSDRMYHLMNGRVWIQESTSFLNESDIMLPVNTPMNPILSVSAIIYNENQQVLLMDHKKCHAWTIPGGKIEEGELPEDALKRELMEELGIVPTKINNVKSNTFLCMYPDKDGKLAPTYFTDWCCVVGSYAGTIENKEPEKHFALEWVSLPTIGEFCKEKGMSVLLSNVLSSLEAFSTDVYYKDIPIYDEVVLCSGYQHEVMILNYFANRDSYLRILNKINIPKIQNQDDIPTLRISFSNDEAGFEVHPARVADIELYLPKDKVKDEELFKTIYEATVMMGLLRLFYPNSKSSQLPYLVVNYLLDGALYGKDSISYKRIDYVVSKYGWDRMLDFLDNENPDEFFKLLRSSEAKELGIQADHPEEFLEAGKPITAENLADKIRYATVEKIHRKINSNGINKAKLLSRDIKEKISQLTPDNPVSQSANTTPNPEESKNNSSNESFIETSRLIGNTVPESAYSIYGNLVFINEDAKYDQQLRRILYRDRITQRKDLLLLYDRVKADIPYIKYVFPELDRYNTRNLFVDLYYYNESFFRNNTFQKQKGFELYFDFLDRLVNDKRLDHAGYQKKTIFIPVLDWNKNPSTKMWMYRNDINPISIIYECMLNNPARVKKLFGKMDLVFFGPNCYFKINFSQIEDSKATSMKFRKFIMKILNGESFDAEDEEIGSETSKAVQTKVADKIEDIKGIDITPELDAARKKLEKDKKSKKPISLDIDNYDGKKKESDNKEIPEEEGKSKGSKEDKEKLAIEKDKEFLANQIVTGTDTWNGNVPDEDELLDRIDGEKTREILASLGDDSEVNISAARADRMMQLDKRLLDKEIKGKSVKDILETDTSHEKLETTELDLSSPNEEWKSMQYMNFGKTYDMDADIIKAFKHFGSVSHPLVVRDVEVTNNSTSEDRLELYTVGLEDFRGIRYKVKLDIPVMKNDRFLLRGGERNIQAQFCNMPIIKTDVDSCQIVSNYNKIIVDRFNVSAGRSLPSTSCFLKAADKYKGKKIVFTPGDNTRICAKYHLPIDYIDISSVLSKIECEDFVVYFNQDQIRDDFKIDETFGIPFGYDKKEKKVIYITDITFANYSTFTCKLVDMFAQADGFGKTHKYDDFLELYHTVKPVSRGTYSRASIMSSKIPLVIVCAYSEGLTTVLRKANIIYHLEEKLPTEVRKDINYDWIKFSDGYLVYDVNYNSSLLLNGLKECSTEIYSIGEIDSKNMYLDFLDNYGGRIKADGLDNAYDCTIDPITKEMLEYYKLPTDYITVLLYTNILLSDNKFIRHTDTSSRRVRKLELIAAYTYKVLAEAYRTYANELKHGGSRLGFSVKQSAVIDKFLQDTTSSDSSVVNILNEIENTNAITTKGLSGMNSERAYSLDKRTYDESMLNVLAMSTGFAGNVGITRQATLNMNIDSNRGFVKSIDGDTSKMNTANTLCATEALIPFSSTHDDPMRIAMSFVQTSKHACRTEESDPLLVTNGADEAIAYICSDTFAFKAKKPGKVKEVTDSYMILEYTDGEEEYVNLEETIQKNSDAGFYVPLKLDKDPKFKEGSRIRPGDIVAYDRYSLSNSVGESDHLAYNIGKLAKVAIVNTDEGFEDSGIVTENMSHKLATRIIEKMDVSLDKNTNIFNVAKLGTNIEEGDTLLIWQTPYEDEDVSAILKVMANDAEAVSELGRHTIKSKLTGKIVGIKVYRTCEMEDLSESLQKLVKQYENPIKQLKKKLDSEGIDSSTLPATYRLDPVGRLKDCPDGVKIEFYVEYLDIVAVGDKIVYNAANKAVIKNVLPANLTPTTDFRPNEPVDALVSVTSIAKRMVTSIPIYGALQKLMVELDRSCKDLAGIEYDDSTV